MKYALVLVSAALRAGAIQDRPETRAGPAVVEEKGSIEGTVVDAASGSR